MAAITTNIMIRLQEEPNLMKYSSRESIIEQVPSEQEHDYSCNNEPLDDDEEESNNNIATSDDDDDESNKSNIGSKRQRNSSSTWTVEEDVLLIQSQAKLGNKWLQISNLIPNKSKSECHIRFTSILRAAKREWTDEEDKLLIELVSTYDSDFNKIRKHMPTRTINAMKTRYRDLNRIKKGLLKVEAPPLGSPRQVFHFSQEILEKYFSQRGHRHTVCGNSIVDPNGIIPLSMLSPPTSEEKPNKNGLVSTFPAPQNQLKPTFLFSTLQPSKQQQQQQLDELISTFLTDDKNQSNHGNQRNMQFPFDQKLQVSVSLQSSGIPHGNIPLSYHAFGNAQQIPTPKIASSFFGDLGLASPCGDNTSQLFWYHQSNLFQPAQVYSNQAQSAIQQQQLQLQQDLFQTDSLCSIFSPVGNAKYNFDQKIQESNSNSNNASTSNALLIQNTQYTQSVTMTETTIPENQKKEQGNQLNYQNIFEFSTPLNNEEVEILSILKQ